MSAIVRFLIQYRKLVLIVMGVITAFFIVQITGMKMFTQFLDLFPQTHPYVMVHKQYMKYFGGAYQATLVLEIEKGDVLNIETLSKMQQIYLDVDLIPGVEHFGITSIAGPKASLLKETPQGFASIQVMPAVPKDKEELNELKKRVFTSNLYGTMVSRDMKALRLDANFIEGQVSTKKDFNAIFNGFMKIKEKYEDKNHKIHLMGTPLVYGWIYHYLPHMIFIFVTTSLIIIAMLFGYMYEGGLWWRPFLDGIITSIWGLGFSAWLGFHFDPLIIVIPFLLSARAISHGVQWTERFVEEYRRLNGNIKEAAFVTGVALFPPGLIGIVADTWALLIIAVPPLINLQFPFFHFHLNPIPTLRNLAFIGTFWALSAVFSSLVLNPAFFASFKKLWIPKYKENTFDRILKVVLVKMSTWTFGTGRYVTVGVSIIVLIVAVITAAQLRFGDANPGDPILWQDSQYNLDVEKTNEYFPGVDQMWVVIEGKMPGYIMKRDVVTGMEAMKQYLVKDPNVGYAVSVADMLKGSSMLLRGNDPKMECISAVPGELETQMVLLQMGAGPSDLDPIVDPFLNATNVRIFLRNHEGSTLTDVIGRVKEFIKENPQLMENATIKPAGGLGGILYAANETIEQRHAPILFFILAVIFIHCTLTYGGSLLAGLIFTISLILANFLAFTYMTFRGIGMNINTFPVVSLGIGMGVDYGLYIVSRIIEVYKVEKDLEKSVQIAMTTAGRAVFFTATMMTAGVVFWYFSPLRFQAEMGILLGLLMMVNMIVGVLVLPAVINIIRPRFITHPKW